MGYELHPETPPGGVSLSSYLRDAEAMLRYVKEFAAGEPPHDDGTLLVIRVRDA